MKATVYKGGSYGIRVGQPNARQYFPRKWRDIDVQMSGKAETFSLTPTFWTTCPEFRGVAVKSWLKSHGLTPWPYRKPPQVTLRPLGGRRFRLSYP